MASFAGSARPPFGALMPIDGRTTKASPERTICCCRTPLRCGRSAGVRRRLRRPPAWSIRPEAGRDRLLAMEPGQGAARPRWLHSWILVAWTGPGPSRGSGTPSAPGTWRPAAGPRQGSEPAASGPSFSPPPASSGAITGHRERSRRNPVAKHCQAADRTGRLGRALRTVITTRPVLSWDWPSALR